MIFIRCNEQKALSKNFFKDRHDGFRIQIIAIPITLSSPELKIFKIFLVGWKVQWTISTCLLPVRNNQFITRYKYDSF